MFLYVLGTSQDGGYPQAGCNEICCNEAWSKPKLRKYPSSIAIVDQKEKKYWLLDITPDLKSQIQMLRSFDCSLAGIFITHAHIGHYMGLINLGLEVMNLNEIPVYVMPRMGNFIKNNSLLSQLIINNNIKLSILPLETKIKINNLFSIESFNVPHRNELSETVGYRVVGTKKSAIYLPDIDSWNNFEDKLFTLISENDILFIDGTFYDKSEISYRDASKIPHPSIKETMKILSNLTSEDKKKIHFIHFNHTNDAIRDTTSTYKKIIKSGFSISRENQRFLIN